MGPHQAAHGLPDPSFYVPMFVCLSFLHFVFTPTRFPGQSCAQCGPLTGCEHASGFAEVSQSLEVTIEPYYMSAPVGRLKQ